MKKCPICGNEIDDWQALCKNCWECAKDAYSFKRMEDVNLVERLKGKASDDLTCLMKELCKLCPKFSAEFNDPSCSACALKEKEKLIRAFVE